MTKLFTPRGRINRLEFPAILGGLLLLATLIGLAAPHLAQAFGAERALLSKLVLVSPLIWVFFCACSKRLHDFGWTSKWLIPDAFMLVLGLLPLPALILLGLKLMQVISTVSGPFAANVAYGLLILFSVFRLVLFLSMILRPGVIGTNRFGGKNSGSCWWR